MCTHHRKNLRKADNLVEESQLNSIQTRQF